MCFVFIDENSRCATFKRLSEINTSLNKDEIKAATRQLPPERLLVKKNLIVVLSFKHILMCYQQKLPEASTPSTYKTPAIEP